MYEAMAAWNTMQFDQQGNRIRTIFNGIICLERLEGPRQEGDV